VEAEFKVKMMPIEELRKADYNPRSISDEDKKALERSLKRFGLVEPLVWNEATKRLVGGHQRLDVLLEDGVKEVPVSIVNLPEVEEKALNVTLNNENVAGKWDFSKLDTLKQQISDEIPDAYDQLNMFKIGEGDGDDDPDSGLNAGSEFDKAGPGKHPEMELQMYEHYDYIVLLYKDQRDFMNAMQHFKLKKVDYSFTSDKKIGLGRCLDGAKYMTRFMETYEKKPEV